ncbi:MAG: hypothetical protein ACRD2H_11180 [Terriglobales bacterium]
MRLSYLTRLAVAAAALAVLAFAQPPHPCSEASLHGDYAFEIHGKILIPNAPQWRDGVALTNFDGRGHLTQEDFLLSNGVPVPGVPDFDTGFHTAETGTYHVNGNCTGEMEIDFPPPPNQASGAVLKLMFVLSDRGAVIHAVVAMLTPPGSDHAVPVAITSTGWRLEARPFWDNAD